jgi:DNA-binding transcriptional regulator YhcF (GntR family)
MNRPGYERQRAYAARNREAINARRRAQKAAELHREPIEQALARGLSTTRIMADFAVEYETVKRVRDGLEAANAA